MAPDIETTNWFHQGGFVMYLLTILSIVVVAIVLEKAFFLARVGKKINELKNTVKREKVPILKL